MKMVQRRKANSFAPDDLAVRPFHVRDDSGVVLHDVAIAVDDSGAELA
jgi:hypothetical protein